jgi:hypothetical protein
MPGNHRGTISVNSFVSKPYRNILSPIGKNPVPVGKVKGMLFTSTSTLRKGIDE